MDGWVGGWVGGWNMHKLVYGALYLTHALSLVYPSPKRCAFLPVAVQRNGVVLNHKERGGSVVALGGSGGSRRGACRDMKGKVEALGGGVAVRSGDVNGRRGEALGGGVAQGRNIAAQVITRRQEDKQAGIITEKFSGLRIKYVYKGEMSPFLHYTTYLDPNPLSWIRIWKMHLSGWEYGNLG